MIIDHNCFPRNTNKLKNFIFINSNNKFIQQFFFVFFLGEKYVEDDSNVEELNNLINQMKFVMNLLWLKKGEVTLFSRFFASICFFPSILCDEKLFFVRVHVHVWGFSLFSAVFLLL